MEACVLDRLTKASEARRLAIRFSVMFGEVYAAGRGREISAPGVASRLSMSLSATNARACGARPKASDTILSDYPILVWRSIL